MYSLTSNLLPPGSCGPFPAPPLALPSKMPSTLDGCSMKGIRLGVYKEVRLDHRVAQKAPGPGGGGGGGGKAGQQGGYVKVEETHPRPGWSLRDWRLNSNRTAGKAPGNRGSGKSLCEETVSERATSHLSHRRFGHYPCMLVTHASTCSARLLGYTVDRQWHDRACGQCHCLVPSRCRNRTGPFQNRSMRGGKWKNFTIGFVNVRG